MGVDEKEVLRRFHRVLVREFVSRPPWDLSAPLNVADIYHNLVPFEMRGEELGVRTRAEYEWALLRLLDGEGGYLRVGDKKARERIRDHLSSSDPATGVVSEVFSANVHINPEAQSTRTEEESMEDRPLFDNCPACKEELPQQARVRFCPFCGENVQRILCPSCGEMLLLNWKFCIACGTGVEAEAGN